MTDTPSSILLLRLQSLGSNTNLWGGYLNVAMQMLEQAAKGYQSYALTVDVTISWANYTLGNTGACAVLKLTGTLVAALTMTLPGYMNDLKVINSAGATVTVKCSGGTGVAIPNSRTAMLYCDGVDYYNSAPTWRGSTITPTNAGDLLTYSDVQTLIANAALPATAGTTRVSASDTTAGYLSQKLPFVAGAGTAVTSSISNPAADEDLTTTYALDFTNMTVTTNVAAADRFAVYDATAAAMRYQTRANVVGKLGLILQASGATVNPAVAGNLYPVDCTSGNGTFTGPASATAGDLIGVVKYGANPMTYSPNGLNYYGSTGSVVVYPEGVTILFYTGASRGWVEL